MLLAQKAPIESAFVGAPGAEALLFDVELISEIDVRAAIEQVSQVQSWSLQVNRVDLKISPVERPVRVVVVNLALALRVFSALNRERDAAGRTKLGTGVLLISVEGMPLVPLGFRRIYRSGSFGSNYRPLKSESDRRLQAKRVLGVDLQDHVDGYCSE